MYLLNSEMYEIASSSLVTFSIIILLFWLSSVIKDATLGVLICLIIEHQFHFQSSSCDGRKIGLKQKPNGPIRSFWSYC